MGSCYKYPWVSCQTIMLMTFEMTFEKQVSAQISSDWICHFMCSKLGLLAAVIKELVGFTYFQQEPYDKSTGVECWYHVRHEWNRWVVLNYWFWAWNRD